MKLSPRLPDSISRFLFGHDVFVSYARRDALDYAQELAHALNGRGVAAYVDQLGTPPGRSLPPLLLLRLRLSSMLVLVASPAAARSAAVEDEVRTFKRHSQRFFVVDVEGALDGVAWYRDELPNCPSRRITCRELASGAPTAEMVERIVRNADFNRREQRLRAASRRAAVFLAAVLAAGLAATGLFAARAEQARAQVRAAAMRADSLDRQARRAGYLVDSLTVAAVAAGRRVDSLAAVAQGARSRAEAAGRAEAAARASAAEQARIAGALTGANESREMRAQALDTQVGWTGLMTRAAYLAADAVRARQVRHTDAAVREVIATIPAPESLGSMPGPVGAAAFSPDGRYLAAASAGAVHLWDLRGGTARVLEGAGEPSELRFGMDGELLVGWSAPDGRARGWDVQEGSLVWSTTSTRPVFAESAREIHAVRDSLVRRWDAGTGVEKQPLAARTRLVSLTVSREGRLAGIEADGSVRLWTHQADTSVVLFRVDGAAGVEFSDDGKLLAVALPWRVAVWDLEANRLLQIAGPLSERPRELRFNHDGAQLVLLMSDGVVDVDIRSGEVVGRDALPNAFPYDFRASQGGTRIVDLRGQPPLHVVHPGPLRVLALVPVGTVAATAGSSVLLFRKEGSVATGVMGPMPDSVLASAPEAGRWVQHLDGSLHVWQAGAREPLAVYPDGDRVTRALISANGAALAVVYDSGGARVWRLGSPGGAPEGPGEGYAVPFDTLSKPWLSPTGRYFSVTDSTTERVWDVVARRELRIPPEVSKTVWSISDDERFLMGFHAGRLWAWEIGSTRAAWPLAGTVSLLPGGSTSYSWEQLEPVDPSALAPDGTKAATVDAEGSVRVWEVATGRPLHAFRVDSVTAALSVGFSPGGRYLLVERAVYGVTVRAWVWDLATGRAVHAVPSKGVRQILFSPDERSLATADDSGNVRLLRLPEGREVTVIRNGPGGVFLAFTPDGAQLANTADGGATRITRVSDGEELARLSLGEWPAGLAFTSDGRYLVSFVEGGRVQFWLWRPRDLAERALLPWEGHQQASGRVDATGADIPRRR
ncbi:MAG TPA: WD40 repeat domain-containing protein [Longimicrobium sp.]|nr:WD40 repeat domain-containing protein [Longimicrobium sp.]